MIENLKAMIDLGGGWLKECVRTLFSVLRSPSDFMLSRTLDGNPALLEASGFAAFVSLLNLVTELPLFRTLGVEAETPSYLVVDTVLTYGFWFLYGSIFHAAARIFRGRGSYQATVVCYLYMTAFVPLQLILTIPGESALRRLLLESKSPPDLEFYQRLAPAVTGSFGAVTSSVIAAAAFSYFFFALVSALRTVHLVGRIRGFFICTAGLIGRVTVFALVEAPTLQLFWQAFRKAAG